MNGTTVSVGNQIEVGLRPEHLRVHNACQIEVHVKILERLGGLSITYSEIAGTRFCAALDGGVHAEAYSASEVLHGSLQLSPTTHGSELERGGRRKSGQFESCRKPVQSRGCDGFKHFK